MLNASDLVQTGRSGDAGVDHRLRRLGVDHVVDRGQGAGLDHRPGHVGHQEQLEDGQAAEDAEAELGETSSRPRVTTVMIPIRPTVLMASGPRVSGRRPERPPGRPSCRPTGS